MCLCVEVSACLCVYGAMLRAAYTCDSRPPEGQIQQQRRGEAKEQEQKANVAQWAANNRPEDINRTGLREREKKRAVGNQRRGTNEIRGGKRGEGKCLGYEKGRIKSEWTEGWRRELCAAVIYRC